jgi:ApbE superfamily uncharacterized protein (UPF0280 family)
MGGPVAGATRALLADGRLHFQHGPIDLIIDADGDAAALAAAHAAAWERFGEVLRELVSELGVLRRPVGPATFAAGPVARCMIDACRPFALHPFELFITPMAAVAGAVAEEIAAHYHRPGIGRAYVNNGGDIALVLTPGSRYDIGVVSDPLRGSLDGAISVSAESGIRGIATSGWHGRSFSLGIADSVTVLARTAAQADAAATLVANAVNAEHPAVRRAPACSIKDDTDLGERLVTIAVDTLPGAVVDAALARGRAFAQELCAGGLIIAAWLTLQGRGRAVGQDHRVQIMEAA